MVAPAFRPGLTPLEDRVTPTLTPEQVFGAAREAAQIQGVMERVAARPPALINNFTRAFLNQYLPTLTVQSQQNAAVLAEYQNQLLGETAANPALAPFVGRVAEMRYIAEVNAFAGGFLTQQLGGVPIRTQPPTPAGVFGPVPIPTVFDTRLPGDAAPTATDFTSAANLTDTAPDLNSPFFQAVGDQGLRVADVVQGVGAPLTGEETAVPVLYAGFLAADGTMFDEARTAPATFNLASGVIPGFQQGLVGLRPGGVRNIDIPPELGYGALGNPPVDPANPPATPVEQTIPPNARLIFQVKYAQQPPTTGTGTGTGAGTGTNGFGTGTNGFGTGTNGFGTGTNGAFPIVTPGGTLGTGPGATGTGTNGVGNGGGTLGTGGTVGGTGTPGGIGGTLGSGGNVGTGGTLGGGGGAGGGPATDPVGTGNGTGTNAGSDGTGTTTATGGGTSFGGTNPANAGPTTSTGGGTSTL